MVIAAAGASIMRAQAPRPMGIVDLLNLPRLTEPRLSPDGRDVVFARSDADVPCVTCSARGIDPNAGGFDIADPTLGVHADGPGYRFVAADGGIFSFGAAGFHGSTGDKKLNSPIVGMAG
jgi:hypothetical protein